MEPFGLFQFLQSLLKTPPEQEEKTTTETAISGPDIPPTPPTNETYLQFIANHEKRAHNIKKK